MESHTRSDVLRNILGRIDIEEFTERVLDSFWERPEFQALHPPRSEVRAWVRWNIQLMARWLIDGQPPDESALDGFRERARERAAEGTPPDLVPANFRRGARFAWGAMVEQAHEDERPALLESADLLFEYVDRVSQIFAEEYGISASADPPSPDERDARALLRRLGRDETLLAEDHQLAERIGFAIEGTLRPIVIACPGLPAQRHASLAASLRASKVLAVSEGVRVVGLTKGLAPWQGLELVPASIVAEGDATARGELGRALDELRAVVEVARSRGHSGSVQLESYLPELLLHRSPRIAGLIRRHVYGPLRPGHPELARTLDLLVEHNFDRGATAAALPVHRNTLRDRLARIAELTGVDVGRADGRGLVWLAWLEGGGGHPQPRDSLPA
jgi:hypothetical protein